MTTTVSPPQPSTDSSTRPRTSPRQRAQTALSLTGLAALFGAWWIAGDATRFLPGVGEVFSTLPKFLSTPLVWQEALLTFSRVAGSLAIGFVLGGLAALIMVHSRFWGKVVSAYVAIATAVPSTILALIALFIFRKSDAGVLFVVVVTVFPFIAVLLREGLQATNRSLTEMSVVYRIRGIEALRHVLLPQVTPFAITALRNEYAHGWKVVVLAELFIINSGMGWQFSQAFDRFQLVPVMHWLLLFVAILLATEYFVIRPLETRALRWKEKA